MCPPALMKIAPFRRRFADNEVAHALLGLMRGVQVVEVTELILRCIEQFEDEIEGLEQFGEFQLRVHDTIMLLTTEGIIDVDGGLCWMRGDGRQGPG